MSRSIQRLGAHNVFKKYTAQPRAYNACQHVTYTDGQLVQCSAETKHGKPTCEDCRRKEMTGPTGPKFRGVPTRNRFE